MNFKRNNLEITVNFSKWLHTSAVCYERNISNQIKNESKKQSIVNTLIFRSMPNTVFQVFVDDNISIIDYSLD